MRDDHAMRCEFVLQPVQRQLRCLRDPLQDKGPMRLQHRLAMPAHLARRNRAGRPMTLRPLHNRGNSNTEPGRNGPAALSRQNSPNDPLAQIIRQRSRHPMLASNSSQHLES